MAFKNRFSLRAVRSSAAVLTSALCLALAPNVYAESTGSLVEQPSWNANDKPVVWVDKDRDAINLYDYLDENTIFTKEVKEERVNIKEDMDLCLKENKSACYKVANAFMRQFNMNHRNILLERAIELYHRSCNLGHGESCYRLGKAIGIAEARVVDLRQVLRTSDIEHIKIDAFTKATAIPDSSLRGDAYKSLAECYIDKPKQKKKAYEYAVRGCELGNPDACYLQGISLWLCNIEDHQVPACLDERTRKSTMLKAFHTGVNSDNPEYKSNSWYFLGYELDQRRDYISALQAFQQGCKLNNENACFFAGIAYENAKGTRRNMRQAVHYYDKACQLGGKYGCERIQKLSMQGIVLKNSRENP